MTQAETDGHGPALTDRRSWERRQQIIDRITVEYRELAGLSLTPAQACRIFDMTPELCSRIVDELIQQGVLGLTPEGHLVRGETPSHQNADSSPVLERD